LTKLEQVRDGYCRTQFKNTFAGKYARIKKKKIDYFVW